MIVPSPASAAPHPPPGRQTLWGDPLAERARLRFGVRYLYPIQRFVMANILEGRDQLVILPTGAGKSLCFQLPAELLGGVTLVVVPLRALLRELVDRSLACGMAAASVVGGQSREERERVLLALRRGRLRLLFTTPESLASRQLRGRLRECGVEHLVVDEAHCVAEWGDTFRPAYRRLGEIAAGLAPVRLSAFTATAGPAVLARVREVLFAGRDPLLVEAPADRPNIRYEVLPVLSRGRALEGLLVEAARPALVFSRSRAGAERAARLLLRRFPDRECRFYHAGLYAAERRELEGWFRRSAAGVLAATSAYGMGMNKPDIRTVVHVDLPPSPEAYLQETGRAGRDGGPVRAVLLFCPEELRRGQAIREETGRRRFQQLLGYAGMRTGCRRAALLAFLGQDSRGCPGCDLCDGPAMAAAEGLEEVLSFLTRQRRRFTPRQARLILLGRSSYDTVTERLQRTPGFGLLKGWREEDIEEGLSALQQAGLLRVARRGPWKGLASVPSHPRDRGVPRRRLPG